MVIPVYVKGYIFLYFILQEQWYLLVNDMVWFLYLGIVALATVMSTQCDGPTMAL
jgi:hypothetical protein